MRNLLEIGLQIAGYSLVALSIASFWIPKTLRWKEKLAPLTPLMREMFLTYSLYVWASHVFFAILALGFNDWLLGGTNAAAAMCTFMLLWWLVRLAIQFFGFDMSEIENTRFNQIAKHLLTLLFTGLVTIYTALLFWNIGWLGEGGFK